MRALPWICAVLGLFVIIVEVIYLINDGSFAFTWLVIILGFCQFLQPSLDMIREYYSVLYGKEVTREQIGDMGWQILVDEWKFNEKAGWKAEDDVLSDCLVNEGIGPDNSLKFDVGADVISQVKTRFEPREELFTIKAAG